MRSPPQSSTAVHAYGRFLLSASTQLLVVQDKFIREAFTCECGDMVRLGAERVQIFILAERLKIEFFCHDQVEKAIWYNLFVDLVHT